jgi:hypothetical protein
VAEIAEAARAPHQAAEPPVGRSGNRSAPRVPRRQYGADPGAAADLARCPYRVPARQSRGHDRWPPSQNGLRGGFPPPALPGSGPRGSPFSLLAVRPLSLPVAIPVTRRLVRSSSLDHLADDGQAARRRGRAPRPESPGMHGPNVVSPAQAKAAISSRSSLESRSPSSAKPSREGSPGPGSSSSSTSAREAISCSVSAASGSSSSLFRSRVGHQPVRRGHGLSFFVFRPCAWGRRPASTTGSRPPPT